MRARARRRHVADGGSRAPGGSSAGLSPAAPARRAEPADRRATRVLSARIAPRMGLGDPVVRGAIATELGDRRSRGPAMARTVGEAAGRVDGAPQSAGIVDAQSPPAYQPVC